MPNLASCHLLILNAIFNTNINKLESSTARVTSSIALNSSQSVTGKGKRNDWTRVWQNRSQGSASFLKLSIRLLIVGASSASGDMGSESDVLQITPRSLYGLCWIAGLCTTVQYPPYFQSFNILHISLGQWNFAGRDEAIGPNLPYTGLRCFWPDILHRVRRRLAAAWLFQVPFPAPAQTQPTLLPLVATPRD